MTTLNTCLLLAVVLSMTSLSGGSITGTNTVNLRYGEGSRAEESTRVLQLAKKKKSPKTPKTPKTPKSDKTPKTPKSDKTPKTPKSDKKPKTPKSDKKPKSSKTPTTPSKPFGAITQAANCQLYLSWAQTLKGSSCDATARNSVDCFAGYGEKNNEIVSRLCPEIPKRVKKNGSCVTYLQNAAFKKIAKEHCKASLGFDTAQQAGCKKKTGKNCACYHACIDYLTLDSGFASNGGTCCQNLCAKPVTTTTTTPPPTTAR